MPLELRDRTATVTGVLTVEEVEPLAAWLRATARPGVNLRNCTHLHTGALQALLLFRPTITGRPLDSFLSAHIMPLLENRQSSKEAQKGAAQ
ncbi:hypothetical protein [Planomonospora sp. ID82291]|uniref:hypothetical protein n=1 Tax=Planomonospora sp. ID82291 TaxID=2738136 RepID=UPI0018C42871|nr:hypothetical protein [Planomonospora sp. ID82291]MBG0818600.1 hypothetical protein [Planomonospora sp. ID82291]